MADTLTSADPTSSSYDPLFSDDEPSDQQRAMASVISPRPASALVPPPPDSAPPSQPGQSTPRTGSLNVPPSESIAKNMDTAVGRTAYNTQPTVAPAASTASIVPPAQIGRPMQPAAGGVPQAQPAAVSGNRPDTRTVLVRDMTGAPVASGPRNAMTALRPAIAQTLSARMADGSQPGLQPVGGVAPAVRPSAPPAVAQAASTSSSVQPYQPGVPLATQQAQRIQAYNSGPGPAQYAARISPVATDPNNPDPTASLRPAGNPVMPAIAPGQAQPVNPPTPLDRAQARLAYLTRTGSGVSQIKNPVGRVAAGIADVAGTILAPGIAAAIPGTTLHHNVLLNQAQAQLNNDQDQEQRALQEENTRGEIAERNARISAMQNPTPEAAKTITTDQGIQQWNPVTQRYDIPAGQSPDRLNKYQIITAGDGTMFRVDPADPTHAQPITGPDGKQLTGKQDSKYVQLEGADGKPHTVEVDSRGNTIKDLGPTGEKPPQVSVNTGTWTLDEDKDGNPVLFNSKTGESKGAPNLQKAGTAARAAAAQEKLTEPVNSAMGYANDYLKNGVFTGSGDEALQEKFFELAKPSTGFRMSQPQIDMLQNARSWMGGAEARARHALTGTWFSNQQRQQIVQTMNDLGQSKARVLAAGSQAPSTGSQANGWPSNISVPKGQIGVQLKNGTYGHIAPSARAKFLKDNPGARTF
jgi:hypothetical protein